jgi:hypothetical protein
MQMIGSKFLQFLSQKEIEKLIVNNKTSIPKKYLSERELITGGKLKERIDTEWKLWFETFGY